jgi:fructose-1,6-bisphosphatase/inositol monophosphatase family enzyme
VSANGDLDHLWRVADEAGARGSEVVFAAGSTTRFGQDAESKGVGDWVTEADRASEEAVRAFLERATPDVPVLGEEEGGERGERFWAVDPLDGTTNFMIGFPVVAVSVALVQEGRPLVGSVRAPLPPRGVPGAVKWGRARPGRSRRWSAGVPRDRAPPACERPHDRAAASRPSWPASRTQQAGAAALDLAWWRPASTATTSWT